MEKKRFWDGFVTGAAVLLACLALVFLLVIGGIGLISRNIDWETLLAEYLPAGTELVYVNGSEDPYLDRMGELRAYFDTFFVLDCDREAMENTALRAYAEASGDPYSTYFTAEEYRKLMEDNSGSYVGIGVMVQQNPETGLCSVSRIFRTSDAANAGLMVGDILVSIDKVSVDGLTLDEMVEHIRGEEGTRVELEVLRPSEDKHYTLSVERRQVEVDVVDSRMVTDTIGYISLAEFDDVAAGQFKQAIKELSAQGMQKLIADMRNNPGGSLGSVLDIMDMFLPADQLMFYMEDKQGTVYRYYSEQEALFEGELIVLVNENSASAAEVFTGCMKDYERGLIMGHKTFGKGIVQSIYRLSDGGAVKLTTEHYCTPAGNDIHGKGIEPDISGEDDPQTETDELLEAAVGAFSRP